MRLKKIIGAAAFLVLPAAFASPDGEPRLLTAAEMDRISAGGFAVVFAEAQATSPIVAITSTNTAALATLSSAEGPSGSAVVAAGGAIAAGIGEGSTTDTSVEPMVQAGNTGSDEGTLTISLGATVEAGFLEISTGAAVQVGIVGLGYFP